ncbi:MAG TPA: HlyD family efflux transporter periplasmic adaptor subunit [Vicinamibacterales bacterium]|nr:HlyD family efflux transporter periplasmic adaptor subunit [Vicinamibacterales bacterium]
MRHALAVLCAAALASCSGSNPAPGSARANLLAAAPNATPETPAREDAAPSRPIRWSGTLEAVRSTRVFVPQVTGPTFRMTLTRLVPNGATVARDDIIAEFDPIEQIDQARESSARFQDLANQVLQRQADNAANVEKRRSERAQAEADLAKARLEESKAPVLGVIDAKQNAIRAAKAVARVESLKQTHPEEERADQAALRILELQRDRQKAAHDRALANIEKLRVRAPLAGIVAHSTFFNNGSLVRPQEGDQMTRNNTLLNIFDPAEMLVRASVAEPDGALLHPGLEVTVYVDAYPDMALPARFVTASPVASSPGIGRGLKTFMAVFRLGGSDPRLMPDLSAAVVFDTRNAPATARSGLSASRGAVQ